MAISIIFTTYTINGLTKLFLRNNRIGNIDKKIHAVFLNSDRRRLYVVKRKVAAVKSSKFL